MVREREFFWGGLGENIPPAPFKGGDVTGKQTRTIRCRDR